MSKLGKSVAKLKWQSFTQVQKMPAPLSVSMAAPFSVSMAAPLSVSMATPLSVSMAAPLSVSVAAPLSVSMAAPLSVSKFFYFLLRGRVLQQTGYEVPERVSGHHTLAMHQLYHDSFLGEKRGDIKGCELSKGQLADR